MPRNAIRFSPSWFASVSALAEFKASDLELEESQLRKIKSRHEIDAYEKRIKQVISDFDAKLEALRFENFELQADLKMAEIQRIILVKELSILQECEKRDNKLQEKLSTKGSEKDDIISKTNICKSKLKEKKEEIDEVMDNKKSILAEFDSLVEEWRVISDHLCKTRDLQNIMA